MPEDVTYANDYSRAKTHGGYFDLNRYGVLSFSGPDARDFLQRLTTVDFKKEKGPVMGAFLTNKGGVIALGYFVPKDEDILFMLPRSVLKRAFDHVEHFHFSEKFSVKEEDLKVFGLWNTPPSVLEAVQSLKYSSCVWQDRYRPLLVWITIESKGAEALLSRLEALNCLALGESLFEFLRISAGVSESGKELSEKDLILESGLENVVAQNKGCYPGQEVVERILSYGSVNRVIGVLSWEGKNDVPQVLTACPHPEDDNKYVGLGFVRQVKKSDAMGS